MQFHACMQCLPFAISVLFRNRFNCVTVTGFIREAEVFLAQRNEIILLVAKKVIRSKPGKIDTVNKSIFYGFARICYQHMFVLRYHQTMKHAKGTNRT